MQKKKKKRIFKPNYVPHYTLDLPIVESTGSQVLNNSGALLKQMCVFFFP